MYIEKYHLPVTESAKNSFIAAIELINVFPRFLNYLPNSIRRSKFI